MLKGGVRAMGGAPSTEVHEEDSSIAAYTPPRTSDNRGVSRRTLFTLATKSPY
jgi:hypothetical protein